MAASHRPRDAGLAGSRRKVGSPPVLALRFAIARRLKIGIPIKNLCRLGIMIRNNGRRGGPPPERRRARGGVPEGRSEGRVGRSGADVAGSFGRQAGGHGSREHPVARPLSAVRRGPLRARERRSTHWRAYIDSTMLDRAASIRLASPCPATHTIVPTAVRQRTPRTARGPTRKGCRRTVGGSSHVKSTSGALPLVE